MKRNLWHQRLLLSSLLFPLVLNAPLSQVAAQESVTDPVVETTSSQLEETVNPSEMSSPEVGQAEDQPLAPFTQSGLRDQFGHSNGSGHPSRTSDQ